MRDIRLTCTEYVAELNRVLHRHREYRRGMQFVQTETGYAMVTAGEGARCNRAVFADVEVMVARAFDRSDA